jgi:spermidine/putrescine ABC transporter ATP-binding subunit
MDLELRQIRKTFGRTVAVTGLDLTVDHGKFVALLGPSGCGKTTTLRIIAGFERPDAGEVWIQNNKVTIRPPYRRDVGIVFQNYALFPHMTVFDNIAYGLRRRRTPKAEIERKVANVIDMTRLKGLADRYPHQLSGGQQQRVAVARAVVIQPSVLLLDEPLSNLDAKLRQEMRSELRKLQQYLEIGTVFVTHDQEEALSMADCVAVMNEGQVEQIGAPDEIYMRPRTRFVATFIGDCNFLVGRVKGVEGNVLRFTVGALALKVAVDGAFPRDTTSVTLALRPENITALPLDEPLPTDVNAVDAQVREVIYLGAARHYRVALAKGPELLVYRQGEIRRPMLPGDRVRVVWNIAGPSVYPEGDEPR